MKIAADARGERFRVDGLRDVAIAARGNCFFLVALPRERRQRDHHYVAVPRILFDAACHLQAVDAGHLNIREHQPWTKRFQYLKGFFGAVRGADVVALMLQQNACQLQIYSHVIDNEDGLAGHLCRYSSLRDVRCFSSPNWKLWYESSGCDITTADSVCSAGSLGRNCL